MLWFVHYSQRRTNIISGSKLIKEQVGMIYGGCGKEVLKKVCDKFGYANHFKEVKHTDCEYRFSIGKISHVIRIAPIGEMIELNQL